MFKPTILLAILVIMYSCCTLSQPTGSASGGQSQQGTGLKKVRVLSPAATRAYRLLRNSASDDDDIFLDEDKRNNKFDDYGHMRFGKRQAGGRDFDDYGHMRFGKRQSDDYGIGLRFGK